MLKVNRVVNFALEVNRLIDQGYDIPFENVKTACENKKILNVLTEHFPNFDLELLDIKEGDRSELLDKLWDKAMIGRERKYWYVENKGLPLLIGYSLGIVNDLVREYDI
ncbi:hypothetical protein JXL21_07960 [Candidatus Bathyarchaeota archaeon]|nr:hypothetical protein [Candidatus Bathyarchaeota archaeon]